MSADVVDADSMLRMRVRNKAKIAQDITLFELVSGDEDVALPPFTAGSHIEVVTPDGARRQYSLCNPPADVHRYVIAIKREAAGRGGSISLIDTVDVGDEMSVSLPRNYFSLDPDANPSLLIAGGIGITPILSMARALQADNRPFRLIYCTRTPEATAFADELRGDDFAAHTLIHHDYGDPSRSLDLKSLLAERAGGAALYCCGPAPLMQAVRDASRHWPRASVHFEDFSLSSAPARVGDRAFSVRLARRGVTLVVPPGVSILETLRLHGIRTSSSCESGTCGACMTKLLEGEPDHRDYVLDEDNAGEIMICVSRARSDTLVLDL
jgi:phthalate 4,5-dioxygenase reductase subunit